MAGKWEIMYDLRADFSQASEDSVVKLDKFKRRLYLAVVLMGALVVLALFLLRPSATMGAPFDLINITAWPKNFSLGNERSFVSFVKDLTHIRLNTRI